MDYFTSTAKEIALEDRWDPEQKRVICAVDINAELEDEPDVLGFEEARKFVEAKKANQSTSTATDTALPVSRPSLSSPNQTNEEIQRAATEKINALTNAAEAAYYKDDDSISTLGSLGMDGQGSVRTNLTTGTRSQVHNTSGTRHSTDSYLQSTNENSSVVSAITVESFTNLQNQVKNQDAQLSHIEKLLGQMAEVVLRGEQGSQPVASNQDVEAGGTNGASGEGL